MNAAEVSGVGSIKKLGGGGRFRGALFERKGHNVNATIKFRMFC